MPDSTHSTVDHNQTDDSQSPWFSIDDFLGFENLTRRVAGLEMNQSPFDGDEYYNELFETLSKALHRKAPRNIVAKRERGVGEYSVFVELARKAFNGVYKHLADKQFIKVDCRYTPPEHRTELLLGIFARISDEPNLIIFIDGIGDLLSNSSNIAQIRTLFVSLVARCPCRILLTVTPEEFEEHFAGRPDTDDFFSTVEINEPSVETGCKLVSHYAKSLEREYGVEIPQEAVRKSVQLTHSFIPSKRMPTKAVKVLNDVCDNISYNRANGREFDPRLREEDVVERVSEISGVPAATLAGLPDGVNYREALGSRIFGQDHVIEEVATELGLIRAGMVDSDKPASVMLFVGQTGTGKTELAKVVAHLYSASKRLKTFTLGNYSEPHSVSGIIGVPPGYVGHEQGGRLVNELNTDPYSVFLLDEADKAHPDVMQPFLNLFDEGWIVDQRGVKGYAERAIFILTTNVGQRQIADMQKKGKGWEEIHTKLMESLSQIRHAKANRPVFSAEFLARLKRVVIFKPLDKEGMASITKKLCEDLIQKWKRERQKLLLISDAVIETIAHDSQTQNEKSKGKEGGRIARKLIANSIEAALQSAIAVKPELYRNCKRLSVDCMNGKGTQLEVRFEQG